MAASDDAWPELPYEAWRPTRDTLHMYLQIVGKVRLALAPMEPQWAQVPLYVTARGLNTSPIPHPAGVFDIDIDLIDHVVAVRTVRGSVERIPLEPRSVADFYAELMDALSAAGVPVTITELPSEVPDAIPFPDDVEHASYEPEWANRFWRVLVSVDAVMKEHRARFRGKTSPVQLFWGTFDLAYSRFSGRPVEVSPDADVITRLWRRCRAGLRGLLARRRETGRAGLLCLHVPEPGRHRPGRRSSRTRRAGILRWASSCCRTKRSERLPIRGRRCSTSSRRRTERAPARRVGTKQVDGRVRQRAFSQPSSPSDHDTAVPRLKISSSASPPSPTRILSLSG